MGKGKEGKVIIIDIMINEEKDEHDVTTTKLLLDAINDGFAHWVTGKERNQKEWDKLFLEAGFSHYKIVSSFGMKSLIVVYP